MKHRFFATALLSVFVGFNLAAQDYMEGQSCTSILVGKNATADGSVITSHTCDGRYRTWATWEPAADHEAGEKMEIRKGTMHTETPESNEGVTVAGEIPQVAHTYSYLNTAYPCLNEKQLAIGESTFSGPDTLVNSNAMFMIEELERVALMRCDNARDAIRLIGELIKKYGYADGGECITIADVNEVWLMEIMGEGPKKIGGIWAAQRIPDGEVGVSANIPRIGRLHRDDPDNFMCSDNIEKVARKFGLWDGNGDFVWYKAFGNSYSNGKNFREREYFILNNLAPSLGLSMDDAEMPFSVKPEAKVDVRKVMELFRSTYEGTDLDMTAKVKYASRHRNENGETVTDTIVSPMANPWMNGVEQGTYNMLEPGTVTFRRTVSVSWCSYSFIAQLRGWLPDEIGGVCWMSVENPGESPRVPIYTGATKMPVGYDVCGHMHYRDDAVLWFYRKANKLAQVRWGSCKNLIINEVLRYEEKAMAEMPELEKRAQQLINEGKTAEARQLVTQYSIDFGASTRQSWEQIEHKFWEYFWTGF